MYKILNWTVASLIILFGAAGIADATPSGEPIVLGEISSQSGVFAMLGGGHKGAQLAVEEINAAGGVLGRPLELMTRDDKSVAAEGTKLFRELASKNVLAILGTSASQVVFAANPLALEMKIPYIISMGYTAVFTEKMSHRYFFRVNPSERVFAMAFAEYMAKQSAKKYCTISNDFAYGRSITETIINRIKELNSSAEVLSGCEFWVPPGTLDLTPQITAIMGRQPDALLFAGVVGTSSDAFVKQAKAFGLFDKIIGIHPSLGEPLNNMGLKKGDFPEGILTGSDYTYPLVPVDSNLKFFKAYKNRWNDRPFETSANAYTMVHLIAKTLQKAGKVDREALVDTLPGMTINHVVMGDIMMRPIDHQSTAGWWMGYLTWDDVNNVVGLRDIKYLPGEDYLPTETQLQEIRTKK